MIFIEYGKGYIGKCQILKKSKRGKGWESHLYWEVRCSSPEEVIDIWDETWEVSRVQAANNEGKRIPGRRKSIHAYLAPGKVEEEFLSVISFFF